MYTLLLQDELYKIDLIMWVLEKYYEIGEIEKKNEVYVLFEHDLNFSSGDESLLQVICHPTVLFKYLNYLCNRVFNNIGEGRLKRKNSIFSHYRKRLGEEYIRIRRFTPVGTYCGMPFIVEDGCFFFLKDEPILVTKYKREQLFEQPSGFPLRQEVRIMSSLAFSLKSGAYSFGLSYDTYDVPIDIIGENCDISSNPKVQFVIHIFDKLKDIDLCRGVVDSRKFDFSTRDYHVEKVEKFYQSFDIMDELALRTCFLLIKAKMLWDEGRLYSEDACANLFISIEGTLRLIYQRIARPSKNDFEIKPTVQHIVAIFDGGEFWVDLLEDIYDKRVQIVHPSAAKWMPELSDDDFYDNYSIALELIYYAITGEILSRED